MAELTPFQTKCEIALQAAVVQAGARLVDREVSGARESYIRARIDGTDLEIYIYSDRAEVQGSGLDERFESPDFRSLDLLCEAFVGKAVELAKNAVA